MRTIYEHSVGGDGAIAGLYADDTYIYETVKYPIAKALTAPETLIDNQIINLEAKWPVLKGALESVRIGYKAALNKFLGVA